MSDPPAKPEQARNWILALAIAWLPVLTPVVGGIWALELFLTQQKEEARTRLIAARQPFLTQQLSLYVETSEISAKLITMTPSDPEWKKDYQHFSRLFWELSLVYDDDVLNPLLDVMSELKICDEQNCVNRGPYLAAAHERLMKKLRSGIERSWGR